MALFNLDEESYRRVVAYLSYMFGLFEGYPISLFLQSPAPAGPIAEQTLQNILYVSTKGLPTHFDVSPSAAQVLPITQQLTNYPNT